LGVFLNGAAIKRPGEHGERVKDDSFYMLFNADHEPLPFTLPPQEFGLKWIRVLDTSTEGPLDSQVLQAGTQFELQSRSVVLLRCVD
jgi:glycogen operon protein